MNQIVEEMMLARLAGAAASGSEAFSVDPGVVIILVIAAVVVLTLIGALGAILDALAEFMGGIFIPILIIAGGVLAFRYFF